MNATEIAIVQATALIERHQHNLLNLLEQDTLQIPFVLGTQGGVTKVPFTIGPLKPATVAAVERETPQAPDSPANTTQAVNTTTTQSSVTQATNVVQQLQHSNQNFQEQDNGRNAAQARNALIQEYDPQNVQEVVGTVAANQTMTQTGLTTAGVTQTMNHQNIQEQDNQRNAAQNGNINIQEQDTRQIPDITITVGVNQTGQTTITVQQNNNQNLQEQDTQRNAIAAQQGNVNIQEQDTWGNQTGGGTGQTTNVPQHNNNQNNQNFQEQDTRQIPDAEPEGQQNGNYQWPTNTTSTSSPPVGTPVSPGSPTTYKTTTTPSWTTGRTYHRRRQHQLPIETRSIHFQQGQNNYQGQPRTNNNHPTQQRQPNVRAKKFRNNSRTNGPRSHWNDRQNNAKMRPNNRNWRQQGGPRYQRRPYGQNGPNNNRGLPPNQRPRNNRIPPPPYQKNRPPYQQKANTGPNSNWTRSNNGNQQQTQPAKYNRNYIPPRQYQDNQAANNQNGAKPGPPTNPPRKKWNRNMQPPRSLHTPRPNSPHLRNTPPPLSHVGKPPGYPPPSPQPTPQKNSAPYNTPNKYGRPQSPGNGQYQQVPFSTTVDPPTYVHEPYPANSPNYNPNNIQGGAQASRRRPPLNQPNTQRNTQRQQPGYVARQNPNIGQPVPGGRPNTFKNKPYPRGPPQTMQSTNQIPRPLPVEAGVQKGVKYQVGSNQQHNTGYNVTTHSAPVGQRAPVSWLSQNSGRTPQAPNSRQRPRNLQSPRPLANQQPRAPLNPQHLPTGTKPTPREFFQGPTNLALSTNPVSNVALPEPSTPSDKVNGPPAKPNVGAQQNALTPGNVDAALEVPPVPPPVPAQITNFKNTAPPESEYPPKPPPFPAKLVTNILPPANAKQPPGKGANARPPVANTKPGQNRRIAPANRPNQVYSPMDLGINLPPIDLVVEEIKNALSKAAFNFNGTQFNNVANKSHPTSSFNANKMPIKPRPQLSPWSESGQNYNNTLLMSTPVPDNMGYDRVSLYNNGPWNATAASQNGPNPYQTNNRNMPRNYKKKTVGNRYPYNNGNQYGPQQNMTYQTGINRGNAPVYQNSNNNQYKRQNNNRNHPRPPPTSNYRSMNTSGGPVQWQQRNQRGQQLRPYNTVPQQRNMTAPIRGGPPYGQGVRSYNRTHQYVNSNQYRNNPAWAGNKRNGQMYQGPVQTRGYVAQPTIVQPIGPLTQRPVAVVNTNVIQAPSVNYNPNSVLYQEHFQQSSKPAKGGPSSTVPSNQTLQPLAGK